MRLESINLEAEEKLLACLERGSPVSAQTKTSKTKLALRPRVVTSHLEPSPPDLKVMNFTGRDLKIQIGDKDSGQKTVITVFWWSN